MSEVNITDMVEKGIAEATANVQICRRTRGDLQTKLAQAERDELYWLGRADALRTLLPQPPPPQPPTPTPGVPDVGPTEPTNPNSTPTPVGERTPDGVH